MARKRPGRDAQVESAAEQLVAWFVIAFMRGGKALVLMQYNWRYSRFVVSLMTRVWRRTD